MSMIWRSAMPLLTTLAALVIIVHCIEEDLDSEYQHHILTRLLEPDPRSTEESRRILQETPIMAEQRDIATEYGNTSDEVPKRRRRKRKRRPHSGENFEIQDRYSYPGDPPRPFYDVDYVDNHKTTETPKRRRKKQEDRPIRWVDDEVMDVERPIRQKGGIRRKRPSVETFPVLSEFGHILINEPEDTPEKIVSETKPTYREEIEEPYRHDLEYKPANTNLNTKVLNVPDVKRGGADDKSLSEFSLELGMNIRATKPNSHIGPKDFDTENINRPVNIKPTTENYKIPEKKLLPHAKIRKKITALYPKTDKAQQHIKYKHKERKPYEDALAKYSLMNEKIQRKYLQNKVPRRFKVKIVCSDYKVVTVMDNTEFLPGSYVEIEQNLGENNQVDPITLKEILKKSNGTSLSEILQQHNLSLSDLLNGNEQAVSILKSKDSEENQNQQDEQNNNLLQTENKHVYRGKFEDEDQDILEENKFVTEVITEYTTERENLERHYVEVETTTAKPILQNLSKPKMATRRRYPTSLRKKLRMRPVLNVTTTRKMQLSKDLIALNGRKYSMQRRNRTKSQEWKSVLGSFRRNNTHNESSTTELQEATTTEAIFPDETTAIPFEIETINPSFEIRLDMEDTKIEDLNESAAATDILTEIQNDTVKVASIPQVVRRPNMAAAGTRQQAFHNKLKRKRIKQKTSAPEETSDNFNLVGNNNLVTSSKFATRTNTPRTLSDDNVQFNALDDVTTTELAINSEEPGHENIKPHTTPKPEMLLNSTAKKEIEEILTDTRIRDKLAIILKERNMTLSELVDHRERGSSHVHLADIFHNASKEPNPPEPFLSKSLIEPISKETYPLRAILEANLHEANSKSPNDQSTLNIPVIVDFRNNVNENAENIGIMSLFDNFINSTTKEFRPEIEDKREPLVSNEANNTFRESRKLNKEDYENWKELISLMKKGNNESEEIHQPKKVVNEDADGDGLIFLEDLQNLYLEHNMALPPLDSTEIYALDEDDPMKDKGILDKIPSQTRSVTIATASIAGLAMILFLLTYAAYKWKQSYVACKSRNFSDQRIPTPVFENRKGHKHNSSSRSISPMLQNSNVYTLDKLESQTGKDIPDYMWDTLRKPFQ